MSHRRRAIVAAAAIATAGLAAVSAAQGAQWTRAAYPATKGASQARSTGAAMAIAQAPNGKAALLYQTRGGAIYGTKRSSAAGGWTTPSQWLAAKKAHIDPTPAVFQALWGGSSVWGLWSTAKGHKVSATTATWKGGVGGTVRTSGNLDGSTTAAVKPVFSVAMSCCVDQAAFGMANGGTVVAGTVPWGKAPSVTSATPQAPNPSPDRAVPDTGVLATSSSGEVAALVTAAGSPTMLQASSNPNAAWVQGAAIEPFATPADIAIDAQGNGVIAYVVSVGANNQPVATMAAPPAALGVFVMQRAGAQGAWSAPQLVTTVPLGATPCYQSFTASMAAGTGNWGNAFDGLQVAVGGGTTALGYVCSGGSSLTPILYVTSAATGQPLAAPTALTDSGVDTTTTTPSLSAFNVSTNAAGQAVAVFGYALTQGQTDSLNATVAPGPGQTWSWLRGIDGCGVGARDAGGGFGNVQVSPFSTGFTVAWECLSGDGTAVANNVGIATYK